MKRAREGEGKLESRFAALTSGLLARKGHASPSNSPIEDPAEETDAFALEPKAATAKRKAAAEAQAAAQVAAQAAKPAAKEAARPAEAKKTPPAAEKAAPARKVEPSLAPAKPQPAAKAATPPVAPKQAPAPAQKPAPMSVINERSLDAGYPDNPSAEEIAALEAEADEVLSYFEKFGNDDAVALEKGSFYGGAADPVDDSDPLDALDDLEDENVIVADELSQFPGIAAGPWTAASVPAVAEPVRAAVTVHLTPREFMRLSLGAADLELSSQEIIADAIEDYLDARGVMSLGGCACLDALTKKP